MNPRRITLMEAVLVGWAVLVCARLFDLQVFNYGFLLHKAERQQLRTIDVSAPRGVIYDRDLHPLAMSLRVDSVFAVPSQIHDIEATAHALAGVLGLDEKDLAGRMHASRSFCWVARKITAEQSLRLHRLDLKGIYFQKEPKRFYPKGTLAAQVLGYVGLDNKGLGGIEREFNPEIQGQRGSMLVQVDAHQHSYNHLSEHLDAGENLVLTIDENIQYIAQQELDAAVASTHALRGTVIVERPSTGEILAMATSPSFNPNDYAHTNPSYLQNPAVTDVYEPGSVFKIVTVSAALQEHLTNPDEPIDCQMGSIWVGGRLIHDHARFGILTPTQIIQHSSDVGAIKLGLRLGDDRFYKYIRAYGFGQKTGIELPGESRGLARPPDRWTPMSIGAISMGQEIAVTPIQVVSMVSAVADGGVYHSPHIVLDRFTGPRPATLPQYQVPLGRRIVSGRVANEMKMMLEQVVLAGTAQPAQLNGYTAAGKTGTAQKVDPGGHGYSKTDYVASFAGFAPLQNPAITVLVVIDSPRGGHEGGKVAGPVFKRIAERVLPYLGVPHDVPVNSAPPSLLAGAHPASEGSGRSRGELADAAQAVTDSGTSDTAEINGDQQPYSPAPGSVIVNLGKGLTVPSFSGQPVRVVAGECERLGLDPILQGHGVAVSQSPAAGVAVVPGSKVLIRFSE